MIYHALGGFVVLSVDKLTEELYVIPLSRTRLPGSCRYNHFLKPSVSAIYSSPFRVQREIFR